MVDRSSAQTGAVSDLDQGRTVPGTLSGESGHLDKPMKGSLSLLALPIIHDASDFGRETVALSF